MNEDNIFTFKSMNLGHSQDYENRRNENVQRVTIEDFKEWDRTLKSDNQNFKRNMDKDSVNWTRLRNFSHTKIEERLCEKEKTPLTVQ